MNYRSSMALLSICVLVFLLDVEYSAVNLALKSISDETNTTLNSVQWVLSAYVLVWGALVLPASRFGNIYGQRNMLFLGLFLFLLGAVMAGASSTLEVLIAGRVVQGIGGAIFLPPCYSIVFAILPQNKQGIGIGIIAAMGSLGLAIGPSLSGLILDYSNWRWIFWSNVPLGLLSWVIGYFYIPKDIPLEAHENIDWLGVISLTVGLGFCTYALNQIEASLNLSPTFLGSIILGVSALYFFWKWNRRSINQTLPSHLFQNRSFLVVISAAFLEGMIFANILIMIGIYLQNILKFSSMEAGAIFLAMSIPLGIISPLGGKMVDRFAGHIPVILGSSFLFVSCFMMIFLNQHSSLTYVIISLALNGIGIGLLYPALNTIALKVLKPEEVNYGSAAFTMAIMLGNTFSIILNAGLCVMVGQIKFQSLLSDLNFTLNENQKVTLKNLIAQIDHDPEQLALFPDAIKPTILSFLDHAFLSGFSITMMGATLCATIIIVISWKKFKYQEKLSYGKVFSKGEKN
ncbi:MAG: MFS transporter [Janthinobacterium lividum]